MESTTEKELDDYLDSVRKVLTNFAWQLAKDHRNELYANLHKLNSERYELLKRFEKLEADIAEIKKRKGIK